MYNKKTDFNRKKSDDNFSDSKSNKRGSFSKFKGPEKNDFSKFKSSNKSSFGSESSPSRKFEGKAYKSSGFKKPTSGTRGSGSYKKASSFGGFKRGKK